jgi:hypothetical protein
VKILYLAPELVARGSTVPLAPAGVTGLPGDGDALGTEERIAGNAVPLRRGAGRRKR